MLLHSHFCDTGSPDFSPSLRVSSLDSSSLLLLQSCLLLALFPPHSLPTRSIHIPGFSPHLQVQYLPISISAVNLSLESRSVFAAPGWLFPPTRPMGVFRSPVPPTRLAPLCPLARPRHLCPPGYPSWHPGVTVFSFWLHFDFSFSLARIQTIVLRFLNLASPFPVPWLWPRLTSTLPSVTAVVFCLQICSLQIHPAHCCECDQGEPRCDRAAPV